MCLAVLQFPFPAAVCLFFEWFPFLWPFFSRFPFAEVPCALLLYHMRGVKFFSFLSEETEKFCLALRGVSKFLSRHFPFYWVINDQPLTRHTSSFNICPGKIPKTCRCISPNNQNVSLIEMKIPAKRTCSIIACLS